MLPARTLHRYIVLTLVCAAASKAPAAEWITLDKSGSDDTYLWREARVDSLERQGPWALFEQRFRAVQAGVVEKGAGKVERVARNCLTGARDAIQYRREIAAGRVQEVRATLDEVEQGSRSPSTLTEAQQSQEAEVAFACDCRASTTATAVSDAERHRLYARDYQRQRTTRDYRLGYIRVESLSRAEQIVAWLDAGKPFAQLADEYSQTKKEFPQGSLDVQPEAAWTLETRRALRSLRAGASTRKPIDGLYGFELFQVIEIIERAAPAFDAARPALDAYGTRAKKCGWTF